MGNGNRQEKSGRNIKASAARAAELVAGSSGFSSGLSAGFGGYAGAQTLATAQSKAARETSPAPVAEAPSLQADSELLQHLRRLTKRDATTRLKALQALSAAASQRPPADLAAILPAWCLAYPSLVLDNSRAVRLETAAVHEAVTLAAGRALALSLKQIAGAWWLAQHDPYGEAARRSRAAYQKCFPGPKGRESLLFCRGQVVEYVQDMLASKMEGLSDMQRDSKEEAQDRHERALTAALALATALLDMCPEQSPAAAAADDRGEAELAQQVCRQVRAPGFLKRMLHFPCAAVRRAAYTFIAHLSRRAPGSFDDIVAEASPLVLGAFSETAAEAHAAMWDMVLSYSKALPAAWHAVNARKAVLPRLYAFLKHGCHGSAEASFPALLPLLTLMPKGLLSQTPPQVLTQLLEAAWEGGQRQAGSSSSAGPAADAFVECLGWSISQAPTLAGDQQEAFIVALLQNLVAKHVLPAAMSSQQEAAASSAASTYHAVAARLPFWRAQLSQMAGAAAVEQLTGAGPLSEEQAALVCPRISRLLQSSVDAGAGKEAAGSVIASALQLVQQGSAPLPVVTMLAHLITQYGLDNQDAAANITSAAQAGTSAQVTALLQAYLDSQATDGNSSAHAELLLACLHQSAEPGDALAHVLQQVLLPATAGQDAAADSNTVSAAEPQARSELACLLLRRLATSVEAGQSSIGRWQGQQLESLAHSLLAASSGQVLGAILAGARSQSLLRPAALGQLLQQLHMSMSSGNNTAAAAVQALSMGLATCACMAAAADAEPQLLADFCQAVVDLFGHCWLAHSQEPDGVEDSVHASAQSVWAAGLASLSSVAAASKAFANELRRRLVTALLRQVQQEADAQDAQQWSGAAAVAASQLLPATASSTADACLVAEQLLHGRQASPSQQGGTPLTSSAAALAEALGGKLGWSVLLLPVGQPPRADLAAQLLLKQAAGGSEHLSGFLQRLGDSAVATGSSTGSLEQRSQAELSQACGELLESVLDRLWRDALSTAHGSSISSSLTALCSLLDSVLQSAASGPVAAQWLSGMGAGALVAEAPAEVLAEVLTVAGPHCRSSQEMLQASGFSQLSLSLLHAASAATPVAHALSRNSASQAEQSLKALAAVALCFPAAAAEEAACASQEECTALQALLHRQLSAEQAAAAAAAAELRLGGSRAAADDKAAEARRQQAGEVLAQLTTAALSYCRGSIAAEHWPLLVRRIASGVASAAVAVENAAEGVADAVLEAARQLPGGQEVGPAAAVELLWQLTHGPASEQAASAVEAAVEGVEQALGSAELMGGLSGQPQAWLAALAALHAHLQLRPAADESAAAALASEWRSLGAEVQADALRALFALGAVQACGHAGGEVAAALAAQWPVLCPGLGASLAAAAEVAVQSPDALLTAAAAADAWAEETGVDAVDSLLALALGQQGQEALQTAAVRMLLDAALLPQLAASPEDEEDVIDEEEQQQAAASAASRDPLQQLARAGARRQLAHGLIAPSAAEEVDVVQLLLSWALLAALLLSRPALSFARKRLSQALLDIDGLVASALDMLIPLLPLDADESPSMSPVNAVVQAAAAAEARAAGMEAGWSMASELQRLVPVQAEGQVEQLAAAVFRGLLHALPASCRSWFSDVRDRRLALAIEGYTTRMESPEIIKRELAGVTSAAFAADDAEEEEEDDEGPMTEFRVRTSLVLREAVAQLTVEEGSMLELALQLPACWPLKPATIEPRRKVGVPEGRLRKWLLSIAALLRSQNGGLAAAIKLWRKNCSQEFTGIEECPICYSVISPNNGQLPKLACSTCSKKFHGACLYKWFSSSGKSACPHCQNVW